MTQTRGLTRTTREIRVEELMKQQTVVRTTCPRRLVVLPPQGLTNESYYKIPNQTEILTRDKTHLKTRSISSCSCLPCSCGSSPPRILSPAESRVCHYSRLRPQQISL